MSVRCLSSAQEHLAYMEMSLLPVQGGAFIVPHLLRRGHGFVIFFVRPLQGHWESMTRFSPIRGNRSRATNKQYNINKQMNSYSFVNLSQFMYSCFRNDIKWQRALAGLLSFVLKYEMLFNITTGVDINQHKRGTFLAKVHSTARKRARGLFTLAIGPIY